MKMLNQIILILFSTVQIHAYPDLNNSELLIASDRLNGSSIQNAFGSSKEVAIQQELK